MKRRRRPPHQPQRHLQHRPRWRRPPVPLSPRHSGSSSSHCSGVSAGCSAFSSLCSDVCRCIVVAVA
eukprot:13442015-Alexandrium_andersonii.AAC.1